MMTYRQFMTSDELRALRAQYQVSAAKLAEAIGISPEHLSRMENGKRAITTQMACAVKYKLPRIGPAQSDGGKGE